MVRIQDIAQRLNLSKTTVSLVLNNRGKELRIGKSTRDLVERVSSEMGYARNEIARAMVTGRNDVIAFVSVDTGGCEYIGKILSGILEEATLRRYALKVYHLAHSSQQNIAKQLIEQRVGGVIFHSDKNDDFDLIRQEAGKARIPSATVNLSSSSAGLGITSDDFQGMRDAVGYLAGLGHRRISYLSSESRREYILNRERGYIEGMKKFLPNGYPQIEYLKSKTDDQNQQAIRKMLSGGKLKRPTAVMCFSDHIACCVLQAAYQMGIGVPESISVMGFADLDIAKFATVPLTTVAQPFELMGRETAKLLIDALTSRKSDILEDTENRKLEVAIVVRQSTSFPLK